MLIFRVRHFHPSQHSLPGHQVLVELNQTEYQHSRLLIETAKPT